MERQWSLKRERARYDAERARRQYDAVEPENRLVARSLERVWEERLRRVDQVEQEYDAWRREQSVSISDERSTEILALGEELPRLWHAATTRSADRKQIVRLVIKEVTLDQKRRRGYVWIKIIWQTGAASEHWLQRCCARLRTTRRSGPVSGSASPSLTGSRRWMARSPHILNKEALRTAHGPPFSGGMVHYLRKRWRIPTVKINGTGSKPAAMARRKLLGAGRRRGHRHHTAGHIRLAPKRVADRQATRQGYALADLAIARAGRRAQSQGPTHQPIQERGIMKASSRR